MMDVPGATDGHVREELGLYVLGALNDEDTAIVEAHLASCDACWADYDHISAVPAMLAALTEADVRGLLEEDGSPGPARTGHAGRGYSISSDSGRGISASVAVTGHDDAADVALTVRGLALGARYYLSLVTSDGRTVVVGEWLAEGTEHTVAGTVAVSADDISFFAVTGEDRSVILSVPLRRTSNAPGE
jgi:anti-sigma factor RsiW